MEHYFTNKENINREKLFIIGDEAHHLYQVLRKNKGEEIFVTDGERNLYKTVIERIAKDRIECDILESFYNINEPEKELTLYQSLLKNPARFEFVIEKATELGVYEIVPIITENVVNKSTHRTERWQSIALSAMKQSQRCYLPKISSPISFADAIQKPECDSLKLIAHEKEDNYKFQAGVYKFNKSVSIFIGPEGGFIPQEVDNAVSNGFKILNLGKRKLRSETAGILAVGRLLN
jgi:16S rRNA (uracil1498-N3)-methyltransferase